MHPLIGIDYRQTLLVVLLQYLQIKPFHHPNWYVATIFLWELKFLQVKRK